MVLKIDEKNGIDHQREGRETQSTTAEFVKLADFLLHFQGLVFQMSLLLNGLTDKALLGLDLFIFSKALIWAFSFYDSCKQTGDI